MERALLVLREVPIRHHERVEPQLDREIDDAAELAGGRPDSAQKAETAARRPPVRSQPYQKEGHSRAARRLLKEVFARQPGLYDAAEERRIQRRARDLLARWKE